jgi:hypothetical protein
MDCIPAPLLDTAPFSRSKCRRPEMPCPRGTPQGSQNKHLPLGSPFSDPRKASAIQGIRCISKWLMFSQRVCIMTSRASSSNAVTLQKASIVLYPVSAEPAYSIPDPHPPAPGIPPETNLPVSFHPSSPSAYIAWIRLIVGWMKSETHRRLRIWYERHLPSLLVYRLSLHLPGPNHQFNHLVTKQQSRCEARD